MKQRLHRIYPADTGRWARPGHWLLIGLLLLTLSLPAAAARQGEVRLVLDVSGSMKGNDPGNLRANGVRLLVELLPAQLRAGLWTFGDRVANPLPLANVDEQWRQRALAVLPRLTDYQQFTDIERALREAARADGAGPVHVILLTDGMVDIPAAGSSKQAHDAASRRRILERLAPRLAERGVIVDTIALSRNADIPLLRRLAQQTGGLASVAETPEALLRSFLDVLGRVVPRQEVPLDQGRFAIDDRVDSFTALLFHDSDDPAVSLTTPRGETLTRNSAGVRWRHDERFDLITVPSPAEGRWQVNGAIGPGSRILIDSALQLAGAPLPATLYQHFAVPLEAWLEGPGSEEDAIRITAELRQQGTLLDRASLTRDDEGHFHGQLEPGDASGNARLQLVARGETFTRLRQQSVDIAPAISASLADDQSAIALQAAFGRLDHHNTTLTATLQGEALPVDTPAPQRWQVALPAQLPDVSVPVALSARVQLDGETRTIALPPVQLNASSAVGVSGARFDREAPDAQSLANDDEAEAADEDTGWSFQQLWSRAQAQWPQLQRRLTAYTGAPWWAVVIAASGLVWLVLLMRRRRRRRQRHRRREPHL
ncbi:uncharacterized protein (TIGR03503 family) [Kushneria sinocarnis]|uniref:Uncharacterized protein (TIGR03503 family) n=1 Tax=Kushneria sinocarnis TaxID=595502 RepID=A0A420WTL7_9GAMM|nr:vWA domain-containing protein [Kushneria sinocarnis]RKQ96395.1 uncharacterized protein (TIGR03503 family) [Kushneria sinocarnis]